MKKLGPGRQVLGRSREGVQACPKYESMPGLCHTACRSWRGATADCGAAAPDPRILLTTTVPFALAASPARFISTTPSLSAPLGRAPCPPMPRSGRTGCARSSAVRMPPWPGLISLAFSYARTTAGRAGMVSNQRLRCGKSARFWPCRSCGTIHGIARHVGDGVFAGDELALREPPVDTAYSRWSPSHSGPSRTGSSPARNW